MRGWGPQPPAQLKIMHDYRRRLVRPASQPRKRPRKNPGLGCAGPCKTSSHKGTRVLPGPAMKEQKMESLGKEREDRKQDRMEFSELKNTTTKI